MTRLQHSSKWVHSALSAFLGMVLAAPASAARPGQSLHVESGELALPAPDATGLRVFKGIPYAAPPVGPLRWKPPEPVTPWDGTRPVDSFGADCLQSVGPQSPASRPRSEDCLFLNVWTAGPLTAKRPVFVWIHGGGSQFGSGAEPTYDGSTLARMGLVVVTINYRLGPFGFLSTKALSQESTRRASGNYGFMDDIAALAWVKRNIARFGGDPTRVTVGGESAGSVATSVLMTSPPAHGLFEQAIGESGSALRRAEPGSMGATTLAVEEQHGARLMDKLGVTSLAGARALDAQSLLDAANAMPQAYNLPVIDGYVLPDAPLRLIRSGRFNDVPLLAGWNHDEGSYYAALGKAPGLTEELETVYGRFAQQMAPLYPVKDHDETAATVQAIGHHGLAWPTWLWATSAARHGTSPVYVYQFDQAPTLVAGSKGPAIDVARLGAYHGSEMAYVFGTLDRQDGWTVTSQDRQVSAAMARYWVNFIAHGDPSDTALPAWPAYRSDSAEGPVRMTLSPTPHAILDPDYVRFNAIAAAREALDGPPPAAHQIHPEQ